MFIKEKGDRKFCSECSKKRQTYQGRKEFTLRHTHLSVDYKRAAVAKLLSFDKIESESQQISQQAEKAKVVELRK